MMGKRGPSSFKRIDVERAIRSAREAGLEPAMIEIVAKDGTVFRVYGDRATLTETTLESADETANPWDTVLKGAGDHAPKQKRPT